MFRFGSKCFNRNVSAFNKSDDMYPVIFRSERLIDLPDRVPTPVRRGRWQFSMSSTVIFRRGESKLFLKKEKCDLLIIIMFGLISDSCDCWTSAKRMPKNCKVDPSFGLGDCGDTIKTSWRAPGDSERDIICFLFFGAWLEPLHAAERVRDERLGGNSLGQVLAGAHSGTHGQGRIFELQKNSLRVEYVYNKDPLERASSSMSQPSPGRAGQEAGWVA